MLLHHRYNRSRTWVKLRSEQSSAESREYMDYVLAIGTQIGELTPLAGEDTHDIDFKVRRAAHTMGWRARTWVNDGKVYFFVMRDDLSGF